MTTTNTLTHEETLAAIEANDPPIEVNQYWIIKANDKLYRRLRILAPHPDGGFLFEEQKSDTYRFPGTIGRCPEYNLRRIFTLES